MVLGWTLLATPALANTMELYGFGARLAAMGNTGEAVADGFYATYANPANLALSNHLHLGLGSDLIFNRFSIQQLGGQSQFAAVVPQNNSLLHVGVSSPLPGWLADKAAFGLAFHIPLGNDTRLDAHDARTPQVPMYDTLGDRLALVFGVGIRPAKWISFGISAQLLTSLSGSAQVDLSVLDHRNTSKQLDIQLATRPYPIVGMTLMPSDSVRIGLVWRSKSYVSYALPLTVNVQDFGLLHFQIQGVGLFLPDVFALAGSYRTGRWLTTAGVAWLRWSELPPMAADVQLSLDDRYLTQSRSNNSTTLLAVSNTPVAMGARDILQPRAGLEMQANPYLVLRGGVQYRPTPLPRADAAASYLDAPATTVTVGAGLRTVAQPGVQGKPLQFDIALGYTSLSRRTVEKNDATSAVQATSLGGDSWHVTLSLHHDL